MTREADLLLGRKLVMMFDTETDGWKLVVDAESSLGNVDAGGVAVQRTVIDITGSVAYETMIVSGTAGKRVHVLEFATITSADVTARWQSGWTGTSISGPLRFPNDGDGLYAGSPENKYLYHFRTEIGEMLILDLDAGCQMGGWVLYYEE